jgi:hypothetical protein
MEDCRRPKQRSLSCFAICSLLTTTSVFALDIEIHPGIELSQLALQEKTGDQSLRRDLIAEAIPGISGSASNQYLSLQGDYAFEQRAYYHQKDHLQSEQRFRLASSFTPFDDRLNIYAATSQQQQIVNLNGPVAFDNGIFTENRNNQQLYSVGTRWRQAIGSLANGEMEANWSRVNNSATVISDLEDKHIRGTLINGRWFRRFFWRLDVEHSQVEYIAQQDLISRSAIGEFGVHLGNHFEMLAIGGYEQNPQYAVSSSGETNGYIYEGGLNWIINQYLRIDTRYGRRAYGESYEAAVDWRPSRRTTLEGAIGKSVIGRTYSASVEHQMRRARISVGYNENITTRAFIEVEQAIQLLVDDNGAPVVSEVTGQPIVEISQLFTDRNGTFIRKRWEVALELSGLKNSIVANANFERRIFTEGDTEDVGYGGGLIWTHQLNRRNTFTALTNVYRGGLGGSDRLDNIYQGRLTLSRNFSSQVLASIDYSYMYRNSPDLSLDQRQHIVRAHLSLEI